MVLNASARSLFELAGEGILGQPIMDLIENVNLIRMVSEPSNADRNLRVEQSLALSNGSSYKVRVTVVEGGSRFITLRLVA